MALDSAGNPKVDFAWGNFPLQPNDERSVPGVNGYFTDTFIYTSSPSVWAFTGNVEELSVGDSFVISQHLNPDFNITYEVIDFDGPNTVITNQYFETSGPYGSWQPCRWDKVVENQQVVETIGGGEGDYGWSSTQTKSSLQLDPALDNHVLATGLETVPAGYAGYPGFLANDPDNVPNTTIPDLHNATLEQAVALLTNANLVLGTVTYTEEGATDGNDLKVFEQSLLEGTRVNQGTAVDLIIFQVTLFTITFNSNGGSGSQNSVTVRETSPSFVLPSATYTRSNYEFVGWSTDDEAAEEAALLAGSTVNNVAENRTYYAIWHPLLSNLTGGTVVDSGGYRYRMFTSTTDLVITGSPLVADILLVGGGGSSGQYAGGAGAGGVLYASNVTLPSGTNTVTVGAGGGTGGAQGGNTSINPDATGLIAVGGGRGGGYYEVGQDGGSGGGGCGGYQPGGNGTAGQGSNGGFSFWFYGYAPSGAPQPGRCYAGGGGGASQNGYSGFGRQDTVQFGGPDSLKGRGGNGTSSFDSFLAPFSAGVDEGGVRYIAGGGGGYGDQKDGYYFGGLGGGGSLSDNNGGNGCTGTASDGVINTGSGGSSSITNYATGGSGLLIIRYLPENAVN